MVLFLLGALLLEPLLNALSRVSNPPIVAVIQDQSESLVVQKDSQFVKNTYPQLLADFRADMEAEAFVTDIWGFGADLEGKIDPDSLGFDRTGTNISEALTSVRQLYRNQNLGAIVLVTDGIPTAGANPLYQAEAMQQPLYTVLLGDTTAQKDVVLQDVLFNEIAYLNDEMPIRVEVSLKGYNGGDLVVSVMKNQEVLARQGLNIPPGQNSGNVSFAIQPRETGLQQYRVTVSRLQDEISYRNNYQRIFVNVLETRMKIALFAGSPHPDLGALRNTLQRDERYELTEFILRRPGTFYNDPTSYNWEDFDLILLHNYPLSDADRPQVEKLARLIEEEKKPMMFFVGILTNLRVMQPLYKYMALSPKDFNLRSEEVIATFNSDYKRHSTFTFDDAWIDWANDAPPVFRNQSTWEAKPTADVFAKAQIKNVQLDYPVFALQNYLGRKNMVYLGENFWRMRAHAYLEGQSFDRFDDWVINNIKWLTVADDKRKFIVSPNKRVFQGDEPVVMQGQVYDDSYNPVPGVDIRVRLESPDGKEDNYYLNERGEAQYALDIFNLGEGTYRYSAEGTKDGASYGTDKGTFSVGRSNIEHFNLQANRDLMQQMALRSGGQFLYAHDLASLPATLKALPELKPVIDYKKSRLSFLRFPWILILALVLLSLEWVLRKMNSLV